MNSPSTIRQPNGGTITTKGMLSMLAGGALSLLMLLFLCAGEVHASGGYLSDFTALYPGSATSNAGCQVCHVNVNASPSSPRNAYGAAFGAAGDDFAAVEALNSDGVGGTNLQEIQAGTQPGWCVKTAPGCVQQTGTPPAVALDNTAANQLPVSNAGPNQAGTVGQMVQLNGSASSDPEGHLLTYSWTLTRPTGSTATLTNPATVNPTFVPDAAGSYTVQLIVNDGTQNSAPATVTISVAAANLPPVANAGPNQSVAVGATVTLDGSGSTDPERQTLTYSWTFASRPTGSTAALTNPTTVHPTFVAGVAGNYVVQLVVNDGTQNSAPATVTISAAAANLPPVANAGTNQAVNVGQLVALNGSASSDPEAHTLTYSWTFTSRPAGSTAALTNPTAVNPTFTPDGTGNYVVQLVVNDGTQNSAPATVTIAATAANLPPVANAGPAQTVAVGATVTLDGSASSDPEAHALTYSWAFVSRPMGSGATLTNPTAAHPTFVPDLAGQYVVGLVVNDGTLNSTNTANVVITATTSTPVTLTSLTADKTSPQRVGTAITFTAAATGGAPPYEYRWWVYNGTTWLLGRDWAAGATYTWTPSTPGALDRIAVHVRSAGGTWGGASGGELVKAFSITSATPLTLTSLTADKTSPQRVGTAITFTAAATGGAPPYEYRWWVYNGTTWLLGRDWAAGATYTWTPSTPGALDRIAVHVRSAGGTWGGASGGELVISFPVTP